jgi:quercetin dioxygenase-like cupin family protein
MTNELLPPNKIIELSALEGKKLGNFVKYPQFEVIHAVIEAGRDLPPHHAKGSAIVQCLSGKGSFIIGDEAQPLAPGAWIYMEPKMMHAVKAEEKLSLLIIKLLGDQ